MSAKSWVLQRVKWAECRYVPIDNGIVDGYELRIWLPSGRQNQHMRLAKNITSGQARWCWAIAKKWLEKRR